MTYITKYNEGFFKKQYEVAGIPINAKLVSDEYYYDSLIPNIIELHNINDNTNKSIKTTNLYNLILNCSDEAKNIYRTFPQSSYGNYIIDSKISWSFPFEYKYLTINRQLKQKNYFLIELNSRVIDVTNIPPTHQIGELIYVHSTQDTAEYYYVSNLYDTSIKQILFGFGDFNTFTGPSGSFHPTYHLITQSLGGNNLPTFRILMTGSIDEGQTFDNVTSPIIRGWKYGLHSGTPVYTSTIFKRDHFGYIRDMLEQRILTAEYLGTNTQRTAVMVKFVSGTTYVSPYETQSSNMSVYCTSSYPYFDGEVKNR